MIVRLVLTETEATPDRDLLARLALRHRIRAVHCSEPTAQAVPRVAIHRAAGSEERMALRAEAPYPPDLPGRGNTRLTDPRPGHLCGGERHAGGADVRGWAGCIVRVGGLGDRVPGVAGGVTAASALQVRCNLAANPLQMGTCQTNGESAICAGDAGSIRQSRSVQRGMRV